MSFTIPYAMQIVIDDVGWFCGYDDRKIGGPSRTGCGRMHCLDDYIALNELGKAINMKLNCVFVLGEWDMENILGKKIPCFSHYGDNWDNKKYRSEKEIAEIAEFISSAEYIDVALHGLYHGYYSPINSNHDISDFYYDDIKTHEWTMLPEDEVRLRLDTFFEMCEKYKIKKKVNSFTPPTAVFVTGGLSKILYEYGIDYGSTIFWAAKGTQEGELAIDDCGIMFVERKFNTVPWDAIGFDFSTQEPADGIFGAHWPNFLSMEPEKNLDVVKNAAEYFNKCGEYFGAVMSSDLGFCANQAFFKKFSKITESENGVVIDISNVPKLRGRLESFCVSSERDIVSAKGCKVTLRDTKNGFKNYNVSPQEETCILSFI